LTDTHTDTDTAAGTETCTYTFTDIGLDQGLWMEWKSRIDRFDLI